MRAWNREEKGDRWQPVSKVCLDGVVRKFKPAGCDCTHYKHGYGGVKCAAFPSEPKHGCPCYKAPWRCKHFTPRQSA